MMVRLAKPILTALILILMASCVPNDVLVPLKAGKKQYDKGQLDEARESFLIALSHSQASTTQDKQVKVIILLCLGKADVGLGRLGEADRSLREALSIAERLEDSPPSLMYEITRNLAYTYQNTGRFEDAEQFHRRALKLGEHESSPENHALDLNNLASVLNLLNRPVEAENTANRALTIIDSHKELRGEIEPLIRLNLGNAYLLQSRIPDARDTLVGAARGVRNIHGENHPIYAQAIWLVAQVRREEKEIEEWGRLCEQSMPILLRVVSADGPLAEYFKKGCPNTL